MSARRADLIVNPASDAGRTAGIVDRVRAEFAVRGVETTLAVTAGPGDATVLAREARAGGSELVVCVGGDGTINEVVNGLVEPDAGPGGDVPALAVIERGTGRDFVRSHGIPTRIAGAVRVACEGRVRMIDVGRAVLGTDEASVTRLFANHASCGITGDIAARANSTSKRFGGTPSFLWATVRGFGGWSNVELRVQLGDEVLDVTGAAVVCSNGRYLGGGMHLAPGALQDDGLLDVLVIGDVGKLDLALNVHRLYRGTLGAHPRVTAVQAARIEVRCALPLPAEVDGEVARVDGGGAAVFDVLPARLPLLTP
jgi:diacylglycerol kinase (ATP)